MTCSAIDRDANKSKRRAVDMRNQGERWGAEPHEIGFWLLTRVCVLFLINDDRPIDDKMRWVAKPRKEEGGVWGRRLVPVLATEGNAKIQPSNKSKTSFCQGSSQGLSNECQAWHWQGAPR